MCAVNPVVGIAHRVGKMIGPVLDGAKKVAVIGGGPAGMRAALICAERGHSVVLFEKAAVLGGQLTHADYPEFKWALRDYKDYLIAQLAKNPSVEVRLNAQASPEKVKAEGFDAVIVAIGSVPKMPPVAGAEALAKAWTPIGVYGHEQELGHRVVVVGGSESGTETGMYLAECGHEVTVLTRQDILAKEANTVHYYALVQRRWEQNPNFTGIVNAETLSVADSSVTYRVGDEVKTVECDSIVLSGGVQPLDDEAMAYAQCATQVFTIGDCQKAGGVFNCNRTALSAATKI
jgi:NADPH-dependent 2,4-dienoyl-CoA reductase/sulfur reductase-like enzyme